MQTREYTFTMTWDAEDGVWVTYVPDLDGTSSYGETPEEAIAMTKEAIELYLEVAREQGTPVPEPSARVETVEVAVA